MRRLILVSAVLLASCGNPMPTDSDDAPPVRYRHDNAAYVTFTSQVSRDCYEAGLRGDPDLTNACAVISSEGVALIVPNPCNERGSYAQVMCHELGHVNGWPVNHPR